MPQILFPDYKLKFDFSQFTNTLKSLGEAMQELTNTFANTYSAMITTKPDEVDDLFGLN